MQYHHLTCCLYSCKDNPVIENRLDQAFKSINVEDTSNATITDASMAAGGNMTDAPEADMGTSDAMMIETDTEDALRSIYASDCDWDWGTWANLVSMILFFVTGICMVLMGPPTRPPPKEPEIQTITYEQKVNEDGDNVVQEVDVQTETYNPNGGPAWASTAHPTPGVPSNDLQAKPY